MTYRLVYAGGAAFVEIVADDGNTQRQIATCRGAGDWSQAVKDAELIVAALNAYTADD